MATPAAEAGRHERAGEDHDRDDGNESVSGSSYIGSDAPDAEPPACRWRTDRYFDQECSRYFDCPSHIVERAASEYGGHDGNEEDDDDPHERDGSSVGHVGDLSVDGISTGPASLSGTRTDEEQQRPEHTILPTTDPGSLSISEGPEQTDLAGPTTPRPTNVYAVAESSAAGEVTAERDLPETPAPGPTPHATSAASDTSPDLGRRDPAITGLAAPQPPPTTALDSPLTPETDLPRTPVSIPRRPTRDADDHPLPSLPPPSPQRGREEPRLGAPPTIFPGIGRSRAPVEGGTGRRGASPAIVLPRWQPDAEVTLCPICHTQFSIFVRKHHCRKCGRVVCNSCSPHRITIPFQFIVQPPGQARLPRYPHPILGNDVGFADSSALVGGERVRLCNPCVPDPNTSPPQASQLSPGAQRSPHHRSQSAAASGHDAGELSPSRRGGGGYVPFSALGGAYARSRSITMQHERAASGASRGSSNLAPSMQRSILTGTPPTYFPFSSRHPGALDARQAAAGASSSSSSSSGNYRHRRSLPPAPPQPQYQLAEEDECPVCHRELPRRTLANFEALRESHISSCIVTHSAYGGPAPSAAASGADGGEGSSSSSGSHQRPHMPPPRRTGMFPYLATEKDCVDSAECTICLEEFEVGAPMARLECLCRFHHACISAWFVNHPGRCPVHQHDSFGY